MPFMYCDQPAKIVSIQPAVSDSHAGASYVKLEGGAFRLHTQDMRAPSATSLSSFVAAIGSSCATDRLSTGSTKDPTPEWPSSETSIVARTSTVSRIR